MDPNPAFVPYIEYKRLGNRSLSLSHYRSNYPSDTYNSSREDLRPQSVQAKTHRGLTQTVHSQSCEAFVKTRSINTLDKVLPSIDPHVAASVRTLRKEQPLGFKTCNGSYGDFNHEQIYRVNSRKENVPSFTKTFTGGNYRFLGLNTSIKPHRVLRTKDIGTSF